MNGKCVTVTADYRSLKKRSVTGFIQNVRLWESLKMINEGSMTLIDDRALEESSFSSYIF